MLASPRILVSTISAQSSDYGLYRALLELLPLYKGFNPMPLERI
jgi:hypothetical protein